MRNKTHLDLYSLRGIGSEMKCGWIIFDEFLFMSPKVFEALLPTFATGII